MTERETERGLITQEHIRNLPKVELHLHLEGAATPEFLEKLGSPQIDNGDAGATDWADLLAFADFDEFLRAYRRVCTALRGPSEYLELFRHVQRYLQAENIRYAELLMTPAIPWHFGVDATEILDALLDETAGLENSSQVRIRWILDCVRQFGPESAERTAELAYKMKNRGVVGVGLGGAELAVPAKTFAEVFSWVRSHGLFVHIHAGEVGPPQSVWDALEILGANRIGHGIQAARDAKLMATLKSRAVSLDVCLTSNVKTRAWPMLREHPLPLLVRRGVPVSLHTDDPGLFATTLTREYHLAVRTFGFDENDLYRMLVQAAWSAFIPPGEKLAFVENFAAELNTQLISNERFDTAR